MSGEFANPKRNIPIAIFASFALAAALSLGCVLAVLLAGPRAWHEAAFASVLPAQWDWAVSAMAVLLIAVNLFAAIWGVSRMIFALARQGVLPNCIARLSRAKTPRNAVLLFLAIGLSTLLLDRLSALRVDDFLRYASYNFLTLYCLAAIVAAHKLESAWQKRAAGVVAALSCALLAFATSWFSLLYLLSTAAIGGGAYLHSIRAAARKNHATTLRPRSLPPRR